MTVRLAADGTIELDGICAIEDAEKLQRYLIADPHADVDWRSCAAAHTALIQILFAAKAVPRGPPASDFLRDYIEPLLDPRRGASGPGETTAVR
jgi:hypothetical protein